MITGDMILQDHIVIEGLIAELTLVRPLPCVQADVGFRGGWLKPRWLWTVGESWSILRKPMQAQEKCANPTQKGSRQM